MVRKEYGYRIAAQRLRSKDSHSEPLNSIYRVQWLDLVSGCLVCYAHVLVVVLSVFIVTLPGFVIQENSWNSHADMFTRFLLVDVVLTSLTSLRVTDDARNRVSPLLKAS